MSISEKLGTIKQRATLLTAKTEHLNGTYETIEDGLRGSGVEFWWNFEFQIEDQRDPADNSRERDYVLLGYAKLGGEWRLATQAWTDVYPIANDEEEFHSLRVGDPVPLTSASRAIRIEVAGHIESFLDALATEIASMQAKVDRANALAAGDARPEVESIPRPQGGPDVKFVPRPQGGPDVKFVPRPQGGPDVKIFKKSK